MSSTYSTTTTTVASTIQTLWKKKLLRDIQSELILPRFGDNESEPVGSGNTRRFNRFLWPAKVTTAKTSGTLLKGDASAIKALTTNYIDFTMEIWESGFGFDEDVNIQSFLTNDKKRQVVVQQYVRSMEYQLAKKLAQNCMWWNIGKAAAYQILGVPDTVNAANTSFSDTSQTTRADDYWNDSMCCFYNPAGGAYGEAVLVTDYDDAGGADGNRMFSVAPTNTMTTSSQFIISSKGDLSSSNKMTTSGMLDVAAIHEHCRTPRFDGNVLRGIMDSTQHRDLHDDTNWKAYVQYDRSNVVSRYQPLQWFDQQWLIGDDCVYRSDTDNTENEAGDVHSALIFGREAYGVHGYGVGQDAFHVEWYVVDKADSYNITLSQTYLAWKTHFASGVKNATFITALNTGGAGLGFAKLGA